jgi:hypothetical protein
VLIDLDDGAAAVTTTHAFAARRDHELDPP